MLLYRGDGKSPYPPTGRPTSNPSIKLPFSAYEIPQFTLHIDFKRPGAHMPREEANIIGKVKYNLQLNGLNLRCRRG